MSKAHLAAIMEADALIIVYDPNNLQCEREAAIVMVAKEWSKQVLVIDPKAIRLF